MATGFHGPSVAFTTVVVYACLHFQLVGEEVGVVGMEELAIVTFLNTNVLPNVSTRGSSLRISALGRAGLPTR